MLPGLRASAGLLGGLSLIRFDNAAAYKGAAIVLSDGDIRATWPASVAGQGARTLARCATGSLFYVEFKIEQRTNGTLHFGVCNDLLVPTTAPSTGTNSISYRSDGTTWVNGAQGTTFASYGQGDVLTILLNNSAPPRASFFKNGTSLFVSNFPTGGGPWSVYMYATAQSAPIVVSINQKPQYPLIAPNAYWPAG